MQNNYIYFYNPFFGERYEPILGYETGKFLLLLPVLSQTLASPFSGPWFGFVVQILGSLSLFWESRFAKRIKLSSLVPSCKSDIFKKNIRYDA